MEEWKRIEVEQRIWIINQQSMEGGGGWKLMTKKYLPLSGRKQGTLTISWCLFSTVGVWNHCQWNWVVLNLEGGGVTNTKIYTSSNCQSLIPYVKCGSMESLFISMRMSVKLITGELQARVLAFISCPPLHAAWATFYSWLGGARQLPLCPL
jgi:hypothetical protein